ncbi:MAG: Lipoprotein signal peptidase [candidate division TM6 bacterium GW2011_GWF2_38_10]|nr:MAG: Lipoprotein signal peptidase [candidate division TM6 bacterium GW2011_GWF2_38_10]
MLLVGGIGIDRVTKWWAMTTSVDTTLCSCMNFSLLWNRGVTWGLFDDTAEVGFYILLGFIVLVTLFFAVYTFYYRYYCQRAFIVFEICVLSGAISNSVDRFLYGAVIDFIQLHLGSWYWPTFNVADIFIVIGVSGLMVRALFFEG